MLNSVSLKKSCSYIAGSLCSHDTCNTGLVTVLLLSVVPSAGDELLVPKNIFFINRSVACLFLCIMIHVVT